MKKILFLSLLIMLLSSTVATLSAQKLDWQERKKAANLIDDLIEDYINYSEFSDLGDADYSEESIRAFQNLFKEGVVIKDEINPKRAEDGKMAATQQNMAEYIRDIKTRYPDGISARFTKIQADYGQLERRKARIVMERQFRAKDEAGEYVTKVSDVLLEVEMDRYLENIKIVNLTTDKLALPQKKNNDPIAGSDEKTVKPGKSYSIEIAVNDSDPDGDALTYKLKSPAKFGKATVSSNGTCSYKSNVDAGGESDSFVYQVCDPRGACDDATVVINIEPDPVGQGLYAAFSIALGTANMNSGSINWQYGEGGLNRGINDSGISGNGGGSFGIGAEVDYYFTDMIGVGTGLYYNRMSGGFDIQDFEAKYRSLDYTENFDGTSQWDYERIVTVDQLQEDYTLNNIGIPLLLKFKKTVADKIGVFAHAGFLYNIASSSRSKLSGGTIDYEAILYTADGINYGYDNANAIGTHSLSLTEGGVEAILQQRGEVYTYEDIASHINDNNRGLNVGLDINAGNGGNQSSLNAHLALLGRAGAVYNISEKMGIMAGLQYTSGTLKATNDYTLVDTIMNEGSSRYGAYNSLLNGGVKYSNIGLSLGLTIKL